VVTVAPVVQHHDLKVAAVGLVNMLNCGGAVLGCNMQSASSQTSLSQSQSRSGNGSSSSSNDSSCQLDLIVKGHGTLMLYSNRPPQSIAADLGSFPFEYDATCGKVTVSLTGEHLQQHVAIRW